MAKIHTPTTQQELCEIVAQTASEKTSLDIRGTNSKSMIGNPMETVAGLDLTGFCSINMYEPEELVLSADAGTPLLEIKQKLAENNQAFAFEPPDFSKLLNSKCAGTLGGMVACGFAGPRRILAGSVRDHVLGVKAVSGRGEAFKTGGRVMKNVTGYDLPKILTGSWGTLACMVELTFKVLPQPQTQASISIAGLENSAAITAMRDGLAAPIEVSAAAHIPGARTILRLEGIEQSVRARVETLKALLGSHGDLDVLYNEKSQTVWQKIRDASLLSTNIDNAVWRLSVAPADGAKVLKEIESNLDVAAYFDWGGGLLWLEILNQKTACAAQVRGSIAKFGGHATLIRANESSRAGTSAFQPQPELLAKLSGRIKAAFDPVGVLNPERMYRGKPDANKFFN